MNVLLKVQYKSGKVNEFGVWFDDYNDKSQEQEFTNKVIRIIRDCKHNSDGIIVFNNQLIINFDNVEYFSVR